MLVRQGVAVLEPASMHGKIVLEPASIQTNPIGWVAVLSSNIGNECLFAAGFVEGTLLVGAGKEEKAGGASGVRLDARAISNHLKGACQGRGGGSAAFVQGSAPVEEKAVLEALRSLFL